MNIQDLDIGNLDFDNVGSWKKTPKVITIFLVSLAISFVWYFVDISHQIDNLKSLEKKEVELKQLYGLKQAKAANLENYKIQLQDIQRTFGSLLNQLPSKTEVADLLTDFTQAGLSNGLEFKLFKPKDEKLKDFYAELPIELKVKGEYHEFGKFMSSVAGMPRIVTMHDFTLKKTKKPGLLLEANAKTYRYLDEEELVEKNRNE